MENISLLKLPNFVALNVNAKNAIVKLTSCGHNK